MGCESPGFLVSVSISLTLVIASRAVQEASKGDVGPRATLRCPRHVPLHCSDVCVCVRGANLVSARAFLRFVGTRSERLTRLWCRRPLVIVCAICTYLAVFWYTLSYIPFARDFVKRIFGI